MKKLTIILLIALTMCAYAYSDDEAVIGHGKKVQPIDKSMNSAEVAVNGRLITWAGMGTNETDFDSDGSDSVGYLYVNGELNTTISLSENVRVLLEIELNDKVANGSSRNFATDHTVDIDEAYLEITEFLMDSLTVKIGHQYLYYSLRDNEKAMLFYDDVTGFKGTFKFEKGFLDIFYTKYIETLSSVNSSADQDAYGLHFEWNFTDNIHTIFYLNNITMDNAGADHGNIISVGAGVDYFLIDKKLELFLEVAAQFGSISEDVDQSGLGLDAGVNWNFGELGSIKGLYVELTIGYRSGEDNDTDSSAFYNGMSATIGACIAESNNSDDSPMYLGYANDSYMAIRFISGASWTEKISSAFLVAYFDNTDEDADPYGVELDISSSYQYSEDLKFSLFLAVFLPDDGLAVDGDPVFSMVLQTFVSF